ncbi:hypothetical protein [Mangrovicoccus sp. HB161399]|uniref:hypothetical protein n=1 Tax=Mangrovicoccus sp. HB161399 TaxID=2720392 RepID=UPI0015581451|nr:hypothetical protein [Mangrovicoccus sp. HB161399]
MITIGQYQEFLDRAAAAHGGIIFGLNPYNSSVTPVLEAVEEYVQAPSNASFNAIRNALERMPTDRKIKYRDAIGYLEGVLRAERNEASRLDTETRLRGNPFRVSSDMREYETTFGPKFGKKLQAIGGGGIWMDGGAGEANAMRRFAPTRPDVDCIAFSHSIPSGAAASIRADEESCPNFSYHEIGMFEEYDLSLLAPPQSCDLITDLNGVLYYTQEFDEALRRYLHFLKVGGTLMFTRSAVHIVEGHGKADIGSLADSDYDSLDRWLARILGAKAYRLPRTSSLALKRTSEDVRVPRLKLKDSGRVVEKGHAVTRVYKSYH